MKGKRFLMLNEIFYFIIFILFILNYSLKFLTYFKRTLIIHEKTKCMEFGKFSMSSFFQFTKSMYTFQYLVNRQVTLEERCTLLCMLTDYLAGECIALGLLDSSNKYNTQSFVLLEELASAWNYILQLTRVVEGMEGRKEIIHALLSKRNY